MFSITPQQVHPGNAFKLVNPRPAGKVQFPVRVTVRRRHQHKMKADPNIGKLLVEQVKSRQFAYNLSPISTVKVPGFSLDSNQMPFRTVDPDEKVQIFLVRLNAGIYVTDT